MLTLLRLNLRRSAASLLLLALLACTNTTAEKFSALTTTTPANKTTCKRLIDADSPFFSAFSLLSGFGNVGLTFSDPSVFASLDQSLPALSQCVAELQPLALLSSLATSSPKAVQCWNDLMTVSKTPIVDANGKILFGEALCPAFKTLAPCLTDILVPALENAMGNTNGCCAPLLAQIDAGFGAPLQPAVTTLVHVLGNAFCSERSMLTSLSSTENCGDSLMDNWMTHIEGDNEAAYWNLLNTFQIPNDQVCQAAQSKPFVTTMNQTEQFGASNVHPYGFCYTPMDALQQYVRALPLWQVVGGDEMAKMVERVFAADTCLAGPEFLQWATDDDGVFMKGVRIIDDLTSKSAQFGNTTNATSPSMSPAPTPEPTTAEPNTTSETPTGDASNSDGSNDESTREDEPVLFDPVQSSSASKDSPTIDDLAGSNWTEIVRTKLWELNLVADQLCFHIPNGVSCSFPGELLKVPFPQLNPTSLGSGTGSGTAGSMPSATTPSPSPSPSPSPIPTATTSNSSSNYSSSNSSTTTSSAVSMRHGSVLHTVLMATVAALIMQLL